MKRKGLYHPALVVLHWLTTLLLALTFGLGAWVLVRMPNTPAKVVPLEVHMALGVSLLVLTLARGLVRLRTKPPKLRTTAGGKDTRPLLVRIARPVQFLLYVFTFLMALCGVGLALQAGLPQVVLPGGGGRLPEDFYVFPLRDVHAILSTILALLVVLHLLTWIHYQFLRGVNALAWIWFQSRRVRPEAGRDTERKPHG
jgi:cytochrome b561